MVFMTNRFFAYFILVTGLMFQMNMAISGEFLHPDAAFQFESSQDKGSLQAKWQIEHGYYLYQNRITAFYEAGEESVEIPIIFTSKSVIKNDKNFGEVDVFFDQASIMLELDKVAGIQSINTVFIEYQGCSKEGLCYQPQLKQIDITPVVSKISTSTPTSLNKEEAVVVKQKKNESINLEDLNSTDSISKFLANADFITTIGIFFLLGLGLSLTPCILPMIPILSGIIVGRGESLTTRHGIFLSSSYVLGMAVTYSLAGIAAATFGAKGNIQLYMQNPWVLTVFSLVFVALAMAMFGLYNLALPSRLQNALYNLSNKQQGGHATGVFIMGALSALVVSPCVSAPLAGALVYISSTGDKLIGGSALFVLAIGLGMPLIAIGAGGGKLIPKAGAWMNNIKEFFGVILLAVAIWLISRVLPNYITLLLWALLFIFYAIHTGALEPVQGSIGRMKKAASFTMLFYGCVLFVGAFTGGTSPLQPLVFNHTSTGSVEKNAEGLVFSHISNSDELQTAIKAANAQGKPVMLDFYADWCTACIDMEEHVFNENTVRLALDGYKLLQIDLSSNSPDNQKVLDKFGLFGPPSILFFDTKGTEIKGQRIQGELSAESFVAHIKNNVNACTYQAC